MKKIVGRDSRLSDIRVRPNELDEEQPLARFLITLFRQFEDELIHELEKKGFGNVSVADFNVLRFVDPRGIRAVEIAKLAGVSKQAIGKQIQMLIEKGLLKRVDDPKDSRAQILLLSPQGEKLVNASITIIGGIEDRYSEIVGSSTLLKLKREINKLIQSPTG